MCTLDKIGSVYVLTLTDDNDGGGGGAHHYLTPTLLESIQRALAFVRADSARAGGGAALVTTAVGKFFSNGVDVEWALSSPADRVPMTESALGRTIADYIALPMPTVAAVTGHAAGAGFGLVLCHDHVVMRSDRGFLYMNELDIGVPLPPSRIFAALVRSKIANTRTLRDVVLTPYRITAERAVAMGIVDRAVRGAEETVGAAVRLGEELAARKWNGSVYASVRKIVFAEVAESVSCYAVASRL